MSTREHVCLFELTELYPRHCFDPSIFLSVPLCVFLSLPPPVCLCLRVICRHLRSGRGVVLVLLAVLHESGPNLIGWMSCDAVPASVQLVQQHFPFSPVGCFFAVFPRPMCLCIHVYAFVCLCEY